MFYFSLFKSIFFRPQTQQQLCSSQLSHSAILTAFQLGFGPTRHFSGLWWQSISANMLGQQSVKKQSNKPPSGYFSFLKALKKKPIAKVSYLDYICSYCKQDDSSLILARMSSSLQTSNTKQSNGDFKSQWGSIDLPLSSNFIFNNWLGTKKRCVYDPLCSIINFLLLNPGQTVL